MFGLSSCIEKMSIPLAAHTTMTIYTRRGMSFFGPFKGSHSSVLRRILLKLDILTCLIESYPTVYGLNSCFEIKMSIPLAAHTTMTIYAGHEMLIFCPFEGFYFSVLHPILLKLKILARLI